MCIYTLMYTHIHTGLWFFAAFLSVSIRRKKKKEKKKELLRFPTVSAAHTHTHPHTHTHTLVTVDKTFLEDKFIAKSVGYKLKATMQNK